MYLILMILFKIYIVIYLFYIIHNCYTKIGRTIRYYYTKSNFVFIH